MDKELIAMCDCPEIQEPLFATKNDYPNSGEEVDYLWAPDGSPVCVATVRWLLREIENNLKECERLQLTSGWIAELHEGHSPYLSDLLFSSSAQDSPDKALTHVLLWQKGKVWKDGEWVKR